MAEAWKDLEQLSVTALDLDNNFLLIRDGIDAKTESKGYMVNR